MPNKVVLYVEDDENDVFLLRHVLKRAGLPMPLQVVTNGLDARDYLSGVGCYRNREIYPLPSLVLLDWKLPGLSGYEVLCWLRGKPAYTTLPVAIFSSSGQEADIRAAYAAGADAYLVKPGSLEQLLQILQGITAFLASLTPRIDLLPGIEPKVRANKVPVPIAVRA